MSFEQRDDDSLTTVSASQQQPQNLLWLQPEAASRFDFAQFYCQVADIPPHLMTTYRLASLVKRLDWNDKNLRELVWKKVLFKPDRLGLKNLPGDEFISFLVVSMLPQQSSIVHKHDFSLEVAIVLQGTVTVRVFTRNQAQMLVPKDEFEVKAGGIFCTERYEYHQIFNKGSESSVSVHCHTPGLD